MVHWSTGAIYALHEKQGSNTEGIREKRKYRVFEISLDVP